MNLTFWDFGIITAVTAIVGGISGFFGVGGAFLLVPVLNVALGVPVEMAVAACACQILGLATTSLLARRIKITHFQLPLILAGGLFCGVLLGAHGLDTAKSWGRMEILGRELPVADLLVLFLYCLLLTALGSISWWLAQGNRERTDEERRPHFPPIPPFIDLEFSGRVSITALAWLGVAVGAISGMLGISGGLILIPALTYLLGLRAQQAVMISMVIVWITTAQTAAVHAWNGNVDLILVAALLLGGTFGARIGTEIGLQVRGPQLRLWFSYLLLLTAALIAARLAWLFLAPTP